VKPALIRLAADLSAKGEPYVLATVVWRRAPSSGKEGATALITPDRAVRGWIGGACAEPTVVLKLPRDPLLALSDRHPSIVREMALMMGRLTHASPAVNRLRSAIELIYPLLWWWGWEHGLAAYGRPFEPIYATMVLWVVVGGAIAIHVVEALAMHRFNGMEIHAWRPLDSRFRLVSAGRNSNLAILAASLLFRRPDSGFVIIAWSILIGLIFHSVRLAQLTEQQSQRHKITSWLDR